ncbi:hypothetical protein K438DRAFT_1845788, partial [Mycena galopus ATCC 62051]
RRMSSTCAAVSLRACHLRQETRRSQPALLFRVLTTNRTRSALARRLRGTCIGRSAATEEAR